ncbi:translocation/assembly module TamB domain-containing protein [Ketogulonicigenium vulgare]|uniref:translocation/assembly module TamB domain-containing protein n=1 Tax=Ketogulonicigenium vulgare TaxID=92945 RepID=UPI0023587929|nr:translocation/assembly module TamB domain-containing protein [Ketogulonicigenium vulgare]
MKRHHLIAAFLGTSAVLALTSGLYAQTAEQDRDPGFLAGLIENSLSGAGRNVQIDGFRGLLSSRATIERITIADDDGVWLIAEDLVMDWNRGALFQGRLAVNELGAARVAVLRAPVNNDPGAAPSPEAAPFALPDLPVSVEVGSLNLERIELGDSFLGEEIIASLTGDASLSGGAGDVRIDAYLLETRQGSLQLSGSYSNATRQLMMNLHLQEPEGGILADLANLPGAPSVDLQLAGTGPIDNYSADLTLATAGVERISGTGGVQTVTAEDGSEVGQQFALNITGDMTALLPADYHDFFGQQSTISAQGTRLAAGGFSLPQLAIKTRAFDLQGNAEIDATGWPSSFALRGIIADVDGPVVLPAGEGVTLGRADLDISFDAATGDRWTADVSVTDLDTPTARIPAITLTGGGVIDPAGGGTSFTADLDYAASGVQTNDPALNEALGDTISGRLALIGAADQPFRIESFSVNGPGITADLTGEVDLRESLVADAQLSLQAEDLSRFAALAGLDLGGGADLTIDARYVAADLATNVTITGTTTDLRTGIAEIDPLLAGQSQLLIEAARDTAGTRIPRLEITGPQLSATGQANVTSGASSASVEARLNDLGLVIDGITGPALVNLSGMRTADGAVNARASGSVPGGNLTFTGALPANSDTVQINLTADLSDVAPYAARFGQTVSGGGRISVQGTATTDGSRADLMLDIGTNSVAIGNPQIDPLLVGSGTLTGRILRSDINTVALQDIAVNLPVASATLAGTITNLMSDPAFEGDIRANVPDLAPFSGLAGQSLRGGASATISGRALASAAGFDLNLSAQAVDVDPGIPAVANLLRGTGTISGRAVRGDQGGLELSGVNVAFPNFTITGNLSGAGSAGTANFDARLANIGLFTPEFSGPVTATGTAALNEAGQWVINTSAQGPGNTTATLTGSVTPSGPVNLQLRGDAPLSFANGFIDPMRLDGRAAFDLAVNGAPALENVSGQVRLSNGRLAVPAASQSLNDIGGTITLSGGRAQIDMSAGVDDGGRFVLTGPVTLAAPYNGDLVLDLQGVSRRDPLLYSTSASGRITMRGPLAGGATIAGLIDLGPTEVQVPSSSVGALGSLPEVQHIGAMAAVRQTLERAGLSLSGGEAGASSGGGGGGAAYPLDVTVRAPGRIFIRGRGLDAELGGELRVTGTTANIIPSGQFSLVRGRLSILQQRFDLTEGSVTLEGDFNPVLRLVAQTQTSSGTVVDVTVEGSISEPTVTFSSSPQLPQDEVIAQLLFGRDLSSLSAFQAVQLAAAVGTLMGVGGGGIVEDLRAGAGLDDLDFTQDDEGNAAVRAGKYLSDNIYTDVTVGSNETTINLNLELTDEVTVKGSASSGGDTGLGIFYERDY